MRVHNTIRFVNFILGVNHEGLHSECLIKQTPCAFAWKAKLILTSKTLLCQICRKSG